MGNTTATQKKVSKNPLLNEDLMIPNPESLAVFNNFDVVYAKERVTNRLTAKSSEGGLDLSRALLHNEYDEFKELDEIAINFENIDLSFNWFTTPPFRLNGTHMMLFNLTIDPTMILSLNLRNNKLNSIDGALLSPLVNLERLQLAWNNLMLLPYELFQLTKLKYLDISRNKLTTLSDQVNNLVMLEELDASLNRFDKFPDLSLHNLRVLRVYRNPESNGDIKTMPRLTNMSQLETIHWRCHGTSDMSMLLSDANALAIREIDLSYNHFGAFADCSVFSNVTVLRLCNCGLASLPDSFNLLTNLKKLYARCNKFEAIPDVVFTLIQLVDLDFTVNGITTIDPRIGDLVHLERLGLAYNKISNLPSELAKLTGLKVLRLEYNPIQDVEEKLIKEGVAGVMEALNKKVDFVDSTVTMDEKDLLKNRMRGCLFGQCLGDAMGLATEFLTFPQALGIYGVEAINIDTFWHDGHRARWVAGDYTDDSDQMLLILNSILDKQHIDYRDFANRLFRWIYKGFDVLADGGGLGLGKTVKTVVTHSYFLKQDPHAASKDVWERSNKQLAANGAIMRTCILGIYDYSDIEKVISQTTEIAKVTHYDPRAIASCVAVTTFIAQVLQENPTEVNQKLIDKYINQSYEYALRELRTLCNELIADPSVLQNYEVELKDAIYCKQFHELDLDEDVAIGYTFKSLGSAFTSLRQGSDIELVLNNLVMEAGDADSNACVAGSLLGCLYGYDKLPAQWIQAMPHKQWLDTKISQFITLANN